MKIVIEVNVREDGYLGPSPQYEATYGIMNAAKFLESASASGFLLPVGTEFPITGLGSAPIGTVKVTP